MADTDTPKFPIVEFRDTDPLQDYYSDGRHRWSVARLIDLAKDLPVFDVPVAALDLSGIIWDGQSIYGQAFNVRRVLDADLSYPIILDWDGTIADGRHRIIKAIVERKETIRAVRLTWRPDPDSVADV